MALDGAQLHTDEAALVPVRPRVGQDVPPYQVRSNVVEAHMCPDGSFIWGFVVIGAEQTHRWLQLKDGILTADEIPDEDFSKLPPKQLERLLEDPRGFLVLGNGYPALRYIPILHSQDGNAILYAGPAGARDVMFVKKLLVRSLIYFVTFTEEEMTIRFHATDMTGREVKIGGWQFVKESRIWPRQILELVVGEEEIRGRTFGINVEIRLCGRDLSHPFSNRVPIYDGRARNIGSAAGKPLRLFRKTPVSVLNLQMKMARR